MQALNCAAMRPCAVARVSAIRPSKSALVRPAPIAAAPGAARSPGSGAIGVRHSRALPHPPSPPAPCAEADARLQGARRAADRPWRRQAVSGGADRPLGGGGRLRRVDPGPAGEVRDAGAAGCCLLHRAAAAAAAQRSGFAARHPSRDPRPCVGANPPHLPPHPAAHPAARRPSPTRSAVAKVVGAKNAPSVVTLGFIAFWYSLNVAFNLQNKSIFNAFPYPW